MSSDNVVLIDPRWHAVHTKNPIDMEQQLALRDVHALQQACKDLQSDWRSTASARAVLTEHLGDMLADLLNLAALLQLVAKEKP